MTQKEQILKSFKLAGGKMKLGDILKFYEFGHEWSARASELRKDGYVITCTKGKTPSENVYTLIAPEPSGQMRFR